MGVYKIRICTLYTSESMCVMMGRTKKTNAVNYLKLASGEPERNSWEGGERIWLGSEAKGSHRNGKLTYGVFAGKLFYLN